VTHRHRFALVLALASFAATARADTIDFSGLTFSPSTPNFENGANLAGGFTTGGASFNNSFDPTFGDWTGWSYSKVHDTTTAGFTNQYAAIAGTANNASGIYGVAYVGSQVGGPTEAFINLPNGTSPVSMDVTNTTYATLSMTQGDAFAGPKFTSGDFLTLQITGFKGLNAGGPSVGQVSFSLADFTNGNSLIITNWTSVNLNALAGAESLGFSIVGSRNSTFDPLDPVPTFFLDTPAYFAMESLTVGANAVPEPSSGLLCLAGLGAAGWVARLRRARAAAR
jgi:hypothetical protein